MTMESEDQSKYAEIICEGFTENEIEHLEDFANYGFTAVESGVKIETDGPLVLERLKEYEKADDSPCLKKWGSDDCFNKNHQHKEEEE